MQFPQLNYLSARASALTRRGLQDKSTYPVLFHLFVLIWFFFFYHGVIYCLVQGSVNLLYLSVSANGMINGVLSCTCVRKFENSECRIKKAFGSENVGIVLTISFLALCRSFEAGSHQWRPPFTCDRVLGAEISL